MKKIFLTLIIFFSFTASVYAVVDVNDKQKISLEEAMDLALKGNIELL